MKLVCFSFFIPQSDLAKSRKSLDLTKPSQPFTTNIFLDEDMVPPDNEEIQA
jgi:hypothetical protein